MDILTLLTRVNRHVTLNCNQTATFTTFLHSPILVRSSNLNQPSTSQSSQLSNDAQGSIQTEYPRNGKIMSLVLYTSHFEKHAKLMEDRLKNLPRSEVKLYVNMDHDEHEDLNHLLDTVSTSLDPTFSEADTLLFMVIGEQFETSTTAYCEELLVKTKGPSVPINSIWGKFTATQCQWLRAKPKLFFFCEPHCTDAGVSEEVLRASPSETVTNQSDFLRAHCYGNEIFGELLVALENPNQEITQMLTMVMRKTERETAKRNGRFSHFQSTLTMSAYLSHPSKKRVLLPGVDVNLQNDQHPNLDIITADDNQQLYTKLDTPMDRRSYTNIVSLLGFVIFVCGWIAIAVIGTLVYPRKHKQCPLNFSKFPSSHQHGGNFSRSTLLTNLATQNERSW